jgi:hypothetical protein
LNIGVGGENRSLVSLPFDEFRIGDSSSPRRIEYEKLESLCLLEFRSQGRFKTWGIPLAL